MTLLDNESREQLKQFFESLEKKVEVILITDENNKVAGEDVNNIAKQLFEELKEVSNGKFDFLVRENDKAFAKALGIDTEETSGRFGPLVVFKDNPRVIFLGLPLGHEINVFLEDLKMFSHGHSHLPNDLVEKIKNINRKIEILVFVTPSCPYCPTMGFLAHNMAFLNENVRSIIIDATLYPEMANAFNVMGVPKTVIRDMESKEVIEEIEGAVPYEVVLNKIL